ncbi:hypothetical protein ACFYWU_29450 [Streptomyces chrestomyceticus]|uniref:hypothetical protein n=1 Tax=Streptomyces chrestomyceticus TaxID=68185 RepID=UPI00369C01B8
MAAEPRGPEQVVRGEPVVTGTALWDSPDGKQVRGIWQITPGVVTDTEGNDRHPYVSRRRTHIRTALTPLPSTPDTPATLHTGSRLPAQGSSGPCEHLTSDCAPSEWGMRRARRLLSRT